jgi:hypothetical protein
VLTENEKTVRPPEEKEKARCPRVAPHAIVRAARRVVGRLARLVGLESGDCLWTEGDDGIIYYDGGNVGIGTTSPAATLDIGNTTGNGTLEAVFARLAEGAGSGDGTYLGVRGWCTQSTGACDGQPDILSFSLEHHFYGESNSSVNFYRGGSATGGFITFATSTNTERLRIDASGNVGIGTTSPAHKLDVVGDGNFSGALSVNGLTGGGTLSADLASAINEFSGDSGSGGSKGAVPAPAAGDAAAGKLLGANGGWVSGVPYPIASGAVIDDDIHTYATGEMRCHALLPAAGWIWMGLVTNPSYPAGPGKLLRALPTNLATYDVIDFAGYGGIVDLVYEPSKATLYALHATSGKVVVTSINPGTKATADVINISTYDGGGAPSFCSDGTYLYICTYTSTSKLLKFAWSDIGVVSPTTIAPVTGGVRALNDGMHDMMYAHACRYDGSKVFITSAYLYLNTAPGIMRINGANMDIEQSAMLPDATNSQFTDDFSFDGTYAFCGSELSGNVVAFKKSDLYSQEVILTEAGAGCLGTFCDGTDAVWCVFNSSPGTVGRIGLATHRVSLYTLANAYPNEVWKHDGKFYFTYWELPGSGTPLIASSATRAQSLTAYL